MKREKQLVIRLSGEEKAALAEYAQQNDRSMGSACRMALRAYIPQFTEELKQQAEEMPPRR